MVQLRDDLVDLLDREATERGMSRSALIREAIEAHLDQARRAEIGRQIVEGYERIPQGEPDEWGSLADEAETASIETLQRLDREEREAGYGPW